VADIQYPTAEIRQGKKEDRRRNHRAKIQWPAIIKAKFHYATQLENQLASWFTSWSATC